jgi:hypothetical protein
MQLTTARLKQIIKEELEAITSEMSEEEEEVETELSEGLLNEFTGGDAAQAILALAGGAAAPMLLQALVNMARSVAGKPEENDIKKAIDAVKEKMRMNEAKKKAALAKQKMPAKRGGSAKNIYAKAESHKMKPMGSKGK